MNNELLDAARKTVPALSANAALTERELRPAPASIAAVRDAGLLALTVPSAAGGHEADLHTLVEVLAELGRGCPSTAWVVGLCSAGKSMITSMMGQQARDTLLADPQTMVCASSVARGSSGRRVPGGLRVSGRWMMASGSEVATWATLAVPLTDEKPSAAGLVVVPTAELSIERTWRAAGLAGTSSHTLLAEDVFVPDAFVATDVVPSLKAQFTGGLVALAPMIGAVRGALEVVAAAVAGYRAPYATSYAKVADSPLGRYWFTEASRRTDTAMRRVLDAADVFDSFPPAEAMPVAERIRLRMELSTAAQECREAMELLLDLHGSSGFTNDNPLQRFWRDVAVGTRHPYFTPYILAEDQGRVTFDMMPTVSRTL